MSVILTAINPPQLDHSDKIYHLTDETMKDRLQRVLKSMKEAHLDTLIIYCDIEHGANFAYLTGFVTRFEEGLLILHQDGRAYLVLGNENTKMLHHARLEAQLIHCPLFSLANQPMSGEQLLSDVFKQAQISEGKKVGLVGWKLFTSQLVENKNLYDLPHYLVTAIEAIVGYNNVSNQTALFIDSQYGVRCTCNANEIAHYEFGSSLASDCVLTALAAVEVGTTEMAIGNYLIRDGQMPNVMPIAATGHRFEHARISPSDKKIVLGDKLSLTTGFKGGLASRSGYVAKNINEIPYGYQDYVERLAAPYYYAVVTWLEQMSIGKKGGDIYRSIEEVLPKNQYHWHLNPGHLTADEEWLSSPIYAQSEIILQSGMLLQIDIIPSIPGYAGVSCENGIALANETLRQEIAEDYPDLWQRIKQRRRYIQQVLNINLPEEVLPLSSGVGYYTPLLLNRHLAFIKA